MITRRQIIQGASGLFVAHVLGIPPVDADVPASSTSSVKCVALSSDGKLLAAPVKAKGIALFDYVAMKRLRTLAVPADSDVTSIALFGSGSILASLQLDAGDTLIAAGCADGTVRVWNTMTGEEKGTFSAHQGEVTNLVFSQDGKTIITTSEDEPRIKIWNVARKTNINEFAGHADGVASLALNLQDNTIAVGGRGFNPAIHLFDVKDPAATKRFFGYLRGGHEQSITALAFSHDGKWLASGSLDKTVRVWDVAARKAITLCTGHTEPVITVAFHPQDKTLASGGLDKAIHLWDATSGKELRQLGKFEGEIYALAFAPDGETLVSAGQDGLVRVSLS